MSLQSLQEFLYRFDRSLLVKERGGLKTIYRKERRVERLKFQGHTLYSVKDHLSPVLYLTHDWTRRGSIAERGHLNIWAKLQEMDAWAREDYFRELEKKNELADKSDERGKRGDLEDHVREKRDQFVRATSDINLGIVKKK